MIRRTRLVRLHAANPTTGEVESVEGFQRGRRPQAGHYVLEGPKRLEAGETDVAGDPAQIRTTSLTGRLEVPVARVLWVQVLR